MQTIGERLEQARKKLGLAIEEAASSTKIRSEYLLSLEKSSGDEIPLPEIYIRGFIKNYAKFLKMEPSRLLADFDAPRRAHTNSPFHKTNKEVMGRLDISKPSAQDDDAAPAQISTQTTSPSPADEIFEKIKPAAPVTPEQPKPAPLGSLSAMKKPDVVSPAAPIVQNAAPKAPKSEPTKINLPKWTIPTLISVISLVVLTAIVVSVISSREPATDTPTVEAAVVTPLKLYASGNVTVIVRDALTNTTLYSGILQKGEQKTIPTTGDVQIRYSDGDLLEVEKGSKRYKLGGSGDGKRIIK